MKRISYMLTCVLGLILFASNISALSYDITLTSNDTFDRNNTLSLYFNDVSNDKAFYGMTATLQYDKDKIELIEISGDNNFNLTYNNKTNKIVLYRTTGLTSKNSVMHIKFKNINLANDEEITISLTNIIVSDGNEDIKVESVSKKIKYIKSSSSEPDLSDNNNLTEITINGKKIDFEKEEINYDIIISDNINKIVVDAKSEDENAKVNGAGQYKLPENSSEIEIKVTAENGEEKTYVISVHKEDENNVAKEDLFLTSNNSNRIIKYLIYIIPLIFISILLIIIFKQKKIKL